MYLFLQGLKQFNYKTTCLNSLSLALMGISFCSGIVDFGEVYLIDIETSRIDKCQVFFREIHNIKM